MLASLLLTHTRQLLNTTPFLRTMSQVPSTVSSSNVESIFNAALQAYENKTKNKLLTHPLANQLQSCSDSPTAILSILQDLIQQLDQRRRENERLRNWLNPTVNVLYAFSATLVEGVGLVPLKSLSSQNSRPDYRSSGILACKGDLCGHRCLSLGE